MEMENLSMVLVSTLTAACCPVVVEMAHRLINHLPPKKHVVVWEVYVVQVLMRTIAALISRVETRTAQNLVDKRVMPNLQRVIKKMTGAK